MDRKEKVSIIIPAFNVEKYIYRGLESCINQTYSNLEILVVDDGSTDSTSKVIEQYAKIDKRILFIQQENGGVSSARNNALAHATGEYIIFLDSDDWLELNAVEELINNVSKYEDAFVICSRYIVDEKDRDVRINDDIRTKREIVENEKVLESFLYKYFYFQSSCYKLFKLTIIRDNKLLFDDKISHGEDGLFVFQYLQYVCKVLSLPIPLWNILDRANSASNTAFSENKLSAITAAEKMLSIDISDKVRKEIIKYLIIRGETMFLEACIGRIKDNKSSLIMIRKKLKLYKRHVISNSFTFKEKIKYIVFITMPFRSIKTVMKIKNKNWI